MNNAVTGVLIGSAVLVGSLFGCGGPADRSEPAGTGADAGDSGLTTKGYTEISVGQLHARMAEDLNLLLVNVHVPFEGDLPETDLSIPFDRITQNLDRLPEDRGTEIVLYCRSGRMSAEASEDLVALGFSRVSNLVGGFRAWEAAGYEVVGR